MQIGIILPTRGLVFTECIAGILNSFGDYLNIYTSHNLPTPESFNTLIAEALKDNNTHLYITNDDVVVTPRIVKKLIKANADIAFCPCSIGDFPGYYEKDGEVTMIGTSCILVKAEVMKKIGALDTSKTYITQGGVETEIDKPQEFGGEEVSFSRKARALGYKLTKIDDMCRHLKLIKLGEHRSNNGCHQIEEQ